MAHRTTHRTWVAVAVAAMALGSTAAACSSDEAPDAGGSPPDATEADATDQAPTQVADGGESPAVGDFPIPFPDGVLLDALDDAGIPMDSQRQLYYATDDFDRLVAFYDQWTSDNGEWARSEVDGIVVFQDLDVNALRTITITPEEDPGAQLDGPATFLLLVTDQ